MRTPDKTSGASHPATGGEAPASPAPAARIAGLPVRSAVGLALAVVVVLLLGARIVTGLRSSSGTVPPGTAPTVGHLAPDSTLLTLKNQQLHLDSFRGKVVVLNFWYAECPPCQLELPTLEHTYQADATRGVVFVGADTLDDASTINNYTASVGLTYPVYLDSQGQTAITYGVTATPTTFVIDQSGVVRAKLVGPVTMQSLGKALAPLLAASK